VARVIGETYDPPPPLELSNLPPELAQEVEPERARVEQTLWFLEEALREPRTLSELAQALAQREGWPSSRPANAQPGPAGRGRPRGG
jgi:hypothetical protein